jgi:hypothetical protein
MLFGPSSQLHQMATVMNDVVVVIQNGFKICIYLSRIRLCDLITYRMVAFTRYIVERGVRVGKYSNVVVPMDNFNW